MTIKAKRIRSKNAWNTQFYLIQVTREYHVDQTSFELINRRSYFEHCAYFQRHSLWPRVQCLWPHFRTVYYLSPGEGDGGRRILGGITWFLGEQKGGEQSNPMVIRPDCVDQAEKLLRTLRLLSETSTVTSRTMFVTAFQVPVIIYRLGVATGRF